MTTLNSKHTIPTINSTGSSGQFLTSTGMNGTSNGQVYTTSSTVNWTQPWPNNNILTVQNDPASLDVTGKLLLNGRDLEERLETIEKVLQIPERDVKLEKKHPKLKKLYDDYINALGKYRTFEAIKGEDNVS